MRYICFIVLWLSLSGVSPLVFADGASHQAMLASVYSNAKAVNQYWVSEKLDGVRGHWDGQALWTRGGYRISTPDWYTQDWPSMAMDGELWIDRELFDTVSGIVRSTQADDRDWQRVKFMVFDLPDHGGTFDQRVEIMQGLAAKDIPWLQPVAQFRVADTAELVMRLQVLVAMGSEGLMLHHQDALYRSGRSQDLLKYKLHDDAEARVVGYTQGQGKYTGQVGALIVEREDGRRFRLGSGLSDAARVAPPPVGTWVTYRYNGFTSSGLPRFARFLRVRKDMQGIDAAPIQESAD